MVLWVRNSGRARLGDSSLINLATAGVVGSSTKMVSPLTYWCLGAPWPLLLSRQCFQGLLPVTWAAYFSGLRIAAQDSRSPVQKLFAPYPWQQPQSSLDLRGGEWKPLLHVRSIKDLQLYFILHAVVLNFFSFWSLLRIWWRLWENALSPHLYAVLVETQAEDLNV